MSLNIKRAAEAANNALTDIRELRLEADGLERRIEQEKRNLEQARVEWQQACPTTWSEERHALVDTKDDALLRALEDKEVAGKIAVLETLNREKAEVTAKAKALQVKALADVKAARKEGAASSWGQYKEAEIKGAFR